MSFRIDHSRTVVDGLVALLFDLYLSCHQQASWFVASDCETVSIHTSLSLPSAFCSAEDPKEKRIIPKVGHFEMEVCLTSSTLMLRTTRRVTLDSFANHALTTLVYLYSS